MKVSILILGILVSLLFGQSSDAPRMMVHLLSYIAADYPGAVAGGKVLSPSEYEEQLEFVREVTKSARESADLASDKEIFRDLSELERLVRSKAEGIQVAQQAQKIQQRVLALSKVALAPVRYPDVHRGKTLYDQNCTQCHGAGGHGDGPSGGNLDPKPTSFHAEKMNQISPFQLYNTIRMGVPGTGMAAFENFSDEQIWDLSYYLMTFRRGDAAMLPLWVARSKLAQSVQKYRSGNVSEAKDMAIAAYLEGVEPMEAKLRANNAEFTLALEKSFAAVRAGIETKTDFAQLENRVEEAGHFLAQAERMLSETAPSQWMAFSASAGIVFREAFEAALILITLLGVIRAVGSTRAALVVHAGWMLAMGAGIACWFLSGWLLVLSGAEREVLEGAVSGLAVMILLYFGFWMHRRIEIGKWQSFLSQMVKQTVQGKNLLGLGTIAFMGVFREAFETVLFLRALTLEGGGAQAQWVLAGVVISVVVVIVLSAMIVRMSARLPLRQLFEISTIVLIGLSVVLLGKAIHSFQESGMLMITPLAGVFRSDLFGIYPAVESLFAQVALLLTCLCILLRDRKRMARQPL